MSKIFAQLQKKYEKECKKKGIEPDSNSINEGEE
jgi:hypothetical protein